MTTKATTNKFSPEVRERAVRMVLEHAGDYPTRWAAVESIAAKMESIRICGVLAPPANPARFSPIDATALAASVTDPGQFRSGRHLAAWLGLTPLQNSSGGKERQGRISKMGDKYLRRLLVIGATSLVRRARPKPESVHPHLVSLLGRKPARVATVAMANKTARIVWAVLTRGEVYRADHMPALSA